MMKESDGRPSSAAKVATSAVCLSGLEPHARLIERQPGFFISVASVFSVISPSAVAAA